MTEAPIFRVSLPDSPTNAVFNKIFPDGVPCKDYHADDYNESIPKNFVFEIDYAFCNEFQIKKIFAELGEDQEYGQLDLEHHPYYIGFEEGMKVTTDSGKEWSLEILKQSWIMTNHAKKHNLTFPNLNGEVVHLLIMGLQQALFVEPTEEPLMNQNILMLAVRFIESISMGNRYLKEVYLTGFPCEYMAVAKEQLHLQ